MASSQPLLLVVATMLIMAVPTAGQQDVGERVGAMLSRLMEQHISSCHLVLITTTQYSSVFYRIIREMSDGFQASIVMEVESLLSQRREPPQEKIAQGLPAQGQRTLETSAEDLLLQELMGDAKTTCRTVILDFTITSYIHHTLGMLETSGLSRRPETRVLVVGWRAGVETVLLHNTLRNTLHALYLTLDDHDTPTPQGHPRLRRRAVRRRVQSEGLPVFRRCGYCRNGQAGVELLHHHWNLAIGLLHTQDFFHDQLRNFMGHKFHILSLPNFPYMDYQRNTNDPGTAVTPKDSLAVRALYTLASALNFTYDIREQPDRVWGLQQANGSFSGLMGNLEREETDFCILIAPTPGRLKAMGYSGAYLPDVLSVTSLKPTLLPQHLVLLRPFAGELWLVLLVSVVVWSIILWLLHGTWRRLAGGPHLGLTSAVLYGWGALLERPSQGPSLKASGKVLVGWWLVHCLVICTAFRSSLVAHLTVQGRTQPLETFQDLVERDGWGWGTEPWVLTGLPLEYFSRHTDPVVRTVYDRMELLQADEALQKVLAEGYSFISFRNYISVIVATRYADAQGHTPFYISSGGVTLTSSFGWGFRRGAPFQPRFSQVIWRLRDAGVIDHWKADVMARRVRERRVEAAARGDNTGQLASAQPQSKTRVVLGLQHLQGALYFLLLGHTLALMALLKESLTHSLFPPKQPHVEEHSSRGHTKEPQVNDHSRGA